VSVYGLDDRAIWVRSPAGAKDFSSILCVQTGSGAHPASCPMGNGGPFLGSKAPPGRDADHSPPSSAEVVNECELYLLSPQAPPWRVAVLLYFFTVKSYDMGPSLFTSHPRGRCAADFLSPLKNPSPWPSSNPQPSVKHTNHYTTKATKIR
jgi:hypothetical protein